MQSKIEKVFTKFNFHGESGSLQYWNCSPTHSSQDGCNLTVTGQPFVSTNDHEWLEHYRRSSLEYGYRFVGPRENVGDWMAGRVVQTSFADHRTKHVPNPHSPQPTCIGRLVLPVFYLDARIKAAGVIELLTIVPKESYVEDFNQICNLLKDENLRSTNMGKMIKVQDNDDIIKFPLPFSSGIIDLRQNVTLRLKKLTHGTFRIGYKDANGNLLPISSDEDLQICIA